MLIRTGLGLYSFWGNVYINSIETSLLTALLNVLPAITTTKEPFVSNKVPNTRCLILGAQNKVCDTIFLK